MGDKRKSPAIDDAERQRQAKEEYDRFLTLPADEQRKAFMALRASMVGQRRLFSAMQGYELAKAMRLWSTPLYVISDAFALEAKAIKGTFTKPPMDYVVRRAFLPADVVGHSDDFNLWTMREHLLACAWTYRKIGNWVRAKPSAEAKCQEYHRIFDPLKTVLGDDALSDMGYIAPPKTYEDVVLLMMTLYGDNHPLNFQSLQSMTMAEATAVAKDMAARHDLDFGKDP